jgi:ribonuclease J
VHGEARHLKMHADLAREQGVAPERTFIAHNGAVIELSARKGVMNETVQAGSLMVDGRNHIEDVVLRDRRSLSTDGLVAAVILLDAETGRLLAPVELYSRGFIYMRENEPLINEASELVYEESKRFEASDKSEYSSIKSAVKSRLKSFLYNRTGRTPMILPIVMEV